MEKESIDDHINQTIECCESESCTGSPSKPKERNDSILSEEPIDDSYVEEEVFFGPITKKEAKIIAGFKNRQTEYFNFKSSNLENESENSLREMEETNAILENVERNLQEKENDLNISSTLPNHCETLSNLSFSPKISNQEVESDYLALEKAESKCASFCIDEETTHNSKSFQEVYLQVEKNAVEFGNEELNVKASNTLHNHRNISEDITNPNMCVSQDVELTENFEMLGISEKADGIESNYSCEEDGSNSSLAITSQKSREIFDEADNVSTINSELKEKESNNFEQSSIGAKYGDETKHSLKRESYFTNLQIINVDDTQVYEDFCIDEKQIDEQTEFTTTIHNMKENPLFTYPKIEQRNKEDASPSKESVKVDARNQEEKDMDKVSCIKNTLPIECSISSLNDDTNNISNINLELKEIDLDNIESSSAFVKDKNILKESPSKRESLFSSLKIINVDDTKVYEDFCIDDKEGENDHTQCLPSESKIQESTLDNNEDNNSKESDSLRDPSKTNVINTTNENHEESLPSNYERDSSASLYPSSSSFYSNCENPNYGMLLSYGSNSENNLNIKDNKSLTSEMYSDISFNALGSVDQPQVEIISEKENLEESYHALGILDQSEEGELPEIVYTDASPPRFTPESPKIKFNDTIEEMELLLKYGIDYFENYEKIHKSSAPNESNSSNINEESIVCPVKEMSIMSSNSVQSFNPNFDSTHTSTNIVSNAIESESETENNENLSLSHPDTNKSITPQKSPFKEFPLNCKTSISFKSAIKITPKVNKRKITPINSPIVQNLAKTSFFNIPTPSVSKLKCTPKSKTVPATPSLGYPKKSSASNLLQCSSAFRTPTRNSNKSFPATPNYASAPPLHALSKTAKTSRPFPPKHYQQFLTPQPKRVVSIPQITIIKPLLSNHKSRALNIESPVAKYLQNNPPPPLIATVKPRYKLSPHRVSKEVLVQSPSELNVNVKANLNESGYRRNVTMKKNEEDLRKLAQIVNVKCPLKELNLPKKELCGDKERDSSEQVLPSSIYLKGTTVQLEKENSCKKREIMSDRPPTSIFKHKGRVTVPKECVGELEREWSSSPMVSGPEPSHECLPNIFGRDSLMEVSVYEPHSVHHTNTLR